MKNKTFQIKFPAMLILASAVIVNLSRCRTFRAEESGKETAKKH